MHSTIRKSAMQNGLIIGLFLSLKFIFSTQNSGLLSFLSFMISISIVVLLYILAVKFRDKELDETISYGHAFSTIFQNYLYGSIILWLVMLVYISYINPSFLEIYKEQTLKMYHDLKIQMNDSTYKAMETFFKPSSFIALDMFASAITGAFWALILAAFVKKEKSLF